MEAIVQAVLLATWVVAPEGACPDLSGGTGRPHLESVAGGRRRPVFPMRAADVVFGCVLDRGSAHRLCKFDGLAGR
jgi:hypothetical protein